MSKKRILFTVFCGTSAEVLVTGQKLKHQYNVLQLPNDKVRDSELLIEALQQERYDYVISLGQRPNIKDKVHIETTARKNGICVETAFDCEKLKYSMEQKGLSAKLSDNAGTSFCNELYWNGLQYLLKNQPETKMVFVHVPFEKNISDVNVFGKKLMEDIDTGLNMENI